MSNVTVEGADLALEIGAKIKKDFDIKTLPLMISMIDTICEEKPLKVDGGPKWGTLSVLGANILQKIGYK